MCAPLNTVQAKKGRFLMKELIERIARSLVDQSEAVFVTEINGSHTSIVELRVAKEDIGKIIGKRGRTADALRTIVNAVSSKANKRSRLEIID
jgi:predicted RNA-binding protein YlqC (UPF0109 family)